ncbi:TPM domain-containing protein [Lysobacter sp. CA199]|uniref:TPM domain-containing protein n=1 Tax=Lysobacter sp. CA199 TaxID=3455608 RepID=UPI003F8D2FFA
MPAIPALMPTTMRRVRRRWIGPLAAGLLAMLSLVPALAQDGAQALKSPPEVAQAPAATPAAEEAPAGDATIPPMPSPVVDTTGTLSPAVRDSLEAQALDLQRRKGAQLQILIVQTTRPEEIETYAVRAFEQFKLGRKGIDDGVLLLVAKDDRRVRIEVGYGLEGAITDAQAGRIIQEYITPRFRVGDYDGGIGEASQMLIKLIDGEPLPAPLAESQGGGRAPQGDWVLGLMIGIFAGGFVHFLLSRVPMWVRGLIGGVAIGAGTLLLLPLTGWAVAWAAVAGAVVAMLGRSGGVYVGGGSGSYGGGGWGGGGGGWSGGGGSSGGGGASGSW